MNETSTHLMRGVDHVAFPTFDPERTVEFARRIAKLPTLAALLIKESVNQTVDAMGFSTALDACRNADASSRTTASSTSSSDPPAEPQVTCEECFELLDEYVELELQGAQADDRIPGMRAHLEGCPACHEDYDSLRELVQDEPSS